MSLIELKINEIAKIVANSPHGAALVEFARLLHEYGQYKDKGSMTAARQAEHALKIARIEAHIKDGLLTELFLKVKQAAPALLPDLLKLIPPYLAKDIARELGPESAKKGLMTFFKPAPTPLDQIRTEIKTYIQGLEKEDLQGKQGFRQKLL
jgi:hypothetical protein